MPYNPKRAHKQLFGLCEQEHPFAPELLQGQEPRASKALDLLNDPQTPLKPFKTLKPETFQDVQ